MNLRTLSCCEHIKMIRVMIPVFDTFHSITAPVLFKYQSCTPHSWPSNHNLEKYLFKSTLRYAHIDKFLLTWPRLWDAVHIDMSMCVEILESSENILQTTNTAWGRAVPCQPALWRVCVSHLCSLLPPIFGIALKLFQLPETKSKIENKDFQNSWTEL